MRNKTIKRVFVYVKQYCFTLIEGLVAATAYVLFTLMGPIFIGEAIDYCIGVGKVDMHGILFYLILLLASVLLASAAQWLMQAATRSVSANVARIMRQEAFKGVDYAPLSILDQQSHGDIVSRLVNDADAVGEGILQALTHGLPGIATILGTLIVMLQQSPIIAVAVVVITPLSIFFAAFISKRTAALFKQQTQTQGELSGLINETIMCAETVRAYSYEKEAFRRFDQISESLFTSGQKSVFYSSLTNPGTRFVNSFVYTVVAMLGAAFVVSGSLTVGQLSCVLTYANQYTKPFNEVTGVLTELESAIASARRLFEIIDLPKEQSDAKDAIAPERALGEVKLSKVNFSYMAERPLIRDFNLSVSSGARIAIVGPTGCGKTTFINLLMRFYDIDSGTISVDGVDICKIKRAKLRALYGMVLQDSWLKNASIKENIAYGCPDASMEEIIAAAKESFAHSFIRRLSDGYDTIISQGGGNLSAGQKQLLCITRVMLRKPSILILDEATSSIDTRTELLVQQAFLKLMQGRTSFVVAHRLSTIENADLIIVMRDGRIVERGTHTELLKQDGFYNEIYKSQFAVQ